MKWLPGSARVGATVVGAALLAGVTMRLTPVGAIWLVAGAGAGLSLSGSA